MNWRNIILIFRREVLDQLRDRRTLFMVAVLPILLYPLLGIGMVQMTVLFTEQPRTVVILGAADLPEQPLLDGHRFARQWFRSAGDADKLRVITDLNESGQDQPAETNALNNSDEQILAKARAVRERLLERQQIEVELHAAQAKKQTAEITALESTLQGLNRQLTALFDRSGIQVLIHIPQDFARNLEKRQQELTSRESSTKAASNYPRPVILQNSADEKSVIAHRRVQDVMQAWERSILKQQLHESQLPETLTEPVRPDDIDLALQSQVSANTWAKMFPALLVIMALTGAFYPAVDLCAGEKERGTMETLLICPATRTEIVLGKFLTVLVFSMSTALLNLVSVGFTGKYMTSLAIGGAASRMGDLSLPSTSALIWVIIILIPLATLFSALCLAIATFAKSSKEGQYYLTPLLMVTLGLTMFCLSPATEMQPFYSVMPVIGPGLLLKGLLKGSGPAMEMYLYAIPVLLTSIGYSLLALWWAIEQFGREEVLFREAERFDLRLWVKHLLRDKEPVPTFAEAGFCFLLILLLQFVSWKSFQTAIHETSPEDQGLFQIRLLIIQQIALIATPALMMGLILTTSVRRTFSLRWPGATRMLCAALLPFTLHPLTIELIMSLQWFFPPPPEGMAELMKHLKTADIRLVLLAFAVAPAFCEEIAFRGFLLAGFRRLGRVRLAIVLSSLAFGIIHMIPHQVFNATLLGLVLGAMCVRTRSLFPGIVFHFVYNSLGILHDRFGDLVPTDHVWAILFRSEAGALRYQPTLLCLLAVICVGLLYRILKSSPFAPDPEQKELAAEDSKSQTDTYRSSAVHG
ncbi:ABC transporter permease subunit/CPBP intramembrane protease [Schlesneria paludicola]|uniref:ABC transporter permease subunit/CPBP intramembrane protease n=1 Tax=Schlesneria paludicola TaxID=360056 RepID=UPI00029B0ABF|nr:ABC transporter permease subunit/CPBP intramembrane protease [Schlesneria paludicola]